jgi:hypothetical protein
MRFIAKMLMVVCLCGVAYGQTINAGSFGASENHEYDSIDLATLVPTFHFPVISKPGAIPFNLSIVSPQVCGIDVAGTRWGCGGGDGLVSLQSSLVPATGMSANFYSTPNGPCTTLHVTGLIDPNQGYHPIAPVQIASSTVCGTTTAQVSTIDGSYIKATVTANSFSPVGVSNIVFVNGSHTGNPGIYSLTDAFGNVLSSNTSSITDTLGTSTVGFSNTGCIANADPCEYTYTDTNGNTQNITFTTGSTLQFTPYNNGLCNVNNGGSPRTPVTAINYPDGTSIGIGWDGTAGHTSGLIGSLTLPTGGPVSYTYTVGAIGSCTTPS